MKNSNSENKNSTSNAEEFYSKTSIHNGQKTPEEIHSRDVYGSNQLVENKKRSKWAHLLDQFKDAMIIVLVIASTVSFFTDDRVEAIIIISIVVLNAVIGYIQENRAESSLDSLRKMSSPYSRVIRNGKETEIPSHEVVVGYLILLKAGDFVSADIKLIKTVSLKIQEAVLTGESVPVVKNSEYVETSIDTVADRKNIAYSSGVVTYGRGEGIVVALGMNTEVDKFSQIIQDEVLEETPLQKQLGDLGKNWVFSFWLRVF